MNDLSPVIAADPASLDLNAAWLRRVEQNGAQFVQRVGLLLKEALPHHVTLDVRRQGFLKKTETVTGVRVAFDDTDYILALSPHAAVTSATARKSRGIVLATVPVSLKAWVEGLLARLNASGQEAQGILHVMQQL